MRTSVFAAALGIVLLGTAARGDDPFLRRTVTVQVVEKAGPAVVNITTEQVVERRSPFSGFRNDPFFDRFFHDFFEPQLPETAQSLGSGVIIDAERHVLTNEHVVSRASRIRVSTIAGREYDAELVGADPNNDIAVLVLQTDDELPWIAPGTSKDLMPGEPVIAIGNPFGLSHTVTTGVLSAVDRSIRSQDRVFHGFLQTDASINPGNSGGPLLNAEGSLVGINSAVYNGGQGIGFAIPIDVASRIVDELIAHGELAPVWVGLSLQELSGELHESLGVPRGATGALVNGVRKGSPAARAGVHRGDVVSHLSGQRVESPRGFFEILRSVTPGQEVDVQLFRDGSAQKLSLHAEPVPDSLVAELTEETLGMRLEAGERGGYVVRTVRRGSGAERIGVQAGDLVLGINGRALDGEDALRASVLDLRGRDRALVVVQRGGGRYHVTIPLV